MLFVLDGHGFFDMAAYDEYFNGSLQPYEYPAEKVAESMEKLQKLYPWLNEVTKKYIRLRNILNSHTNLFYFLFFFLASI